MGSWGSRRLVEELVGVGEGGFAGRGRRRKSSLFEDLACGHSHLGQFGQVVELVGAFRAVFGKVGLGQACYADGIFRIKICSKIYPQLEFSTNKKTASFAVPAVPFGVFPC